jgi:recombination protein RecT
MSMSVTSAVEKHDKAHEGATTLRQAIKASEAQFALALPKHVEPARFVRAALTAINVVPKLAECTQTSILAGLMQAAQLGLEVADVRGQAYLIPRWNSKLGANEATFQLGYRGMIDLAARGGITVDVDEICEHDAYDYQRGTAPKLYHKPTLADRGRAIAYYAVAHFSDGRPPSFVIMGRSEVEAHRDKFASSKTKQGEAYGPWADHFDAMARKTVIRQLLNYLPATVELRQAVAIEATATDAEPPLNVSYLPPAGSVLPPANVDPHTGEIDPTEAIEASSAEGE